MGCQSCGVQTRDANMVSMFRLELSEVSEVSDGTPKHVPFSSNTVSQLYLLKISEFLRFNIFRNRICRISHWKQLHSENAQVQVFGHLRVWPLNFSRMPDEKALGFSSMREILNL